MNKPILDPCCGSRMFWFDKGNPDAIFGDIRNESHTLCDGRALEIAPDIEMDFTDMPFPDETFFLVVLDPPHLVNLGRNSWMAKKYGVLPQNWQNVIRDGFNEGMRVLKKNGTLIFKWNETQIPVSEIIKTIGTQPLFGHKSGRQSKTIWMCFMKLN
ncbi:MAG: methyltransferase [Dysgonomonas sp.]|nr:methyltransferase [Dysgonomonas sp.]